MTPLVLTPFVPFRYEYLMPPAVSPRVGRGVARLQQPAICGRRAPARQRMAANAGRPMSTMIFRSEAFRLLSYVIYIYIYIERERDIYIYIYIERERERYIYIYIYMFIYLFIYYIHTHTCVRRPLPRTAATSF